MTQVKGYTRVVNGKAVKVRPYKRKSSSTSDGKEFLSKKSALVEFTDWNSLRDSLTKDEWKSMSLYSYRKDDPRKGDVQYVGFRVGGKLVGVSNVSAENGVVYIGDFEILPKYRKKHYGTRFFRTLQKKYKGETLQLNYGSKSAQKFWESVGFKKVSPNTTIMELNN